VSGPVTTWTETAVLRLRELIALGLSNTRIGAVMSISHHAVAGARYRYRLQEKDTTPPPPPIDLSASVPSPHECRFILDNGPWKGRLPHWCRAPIVPGYPYCEEHKTRCYMRVPR